jgi:hypothetical protein
MLLRPLLRLLIAEQVLFASFAELVKSVYVEMAVTHFRLPDKPVSDSRVTLLTGVHRKDVRRLRAQAEGRAPLRPVPSLGARLVADWNALPRFLDAQGRPLPLHLHSSRGRPSMRDLAETAGRDIRPGAIVDEWLRQGVVTVDEEERVHLVHGAFVPERGYAEKADFFGRNLGAHVAAGAHNLLGEGPPLLDQGVYYGGLSEDSAEYLAERARALAMEALRTLNREAHQLQEADRNRRDNVHRIHFGAYFLREREEEDEAEAHERG